MNERLNVLYEPDGDIKNKFMDRYGKRVYVSDDSDYSNAEADWEKRGGNINGKDMTKEDFIYMIAKLNRKMLNFVCDMYREMLKSPLTVYSIRLIGNANCPIVVFNNEYSLTIYRKNAILHFSDKAYDGTNQGCINMNEWFGKPSEEKKHDIIMNVLSFMQKVNIREIYKIYNANCPEKSPICYCGHDGIAPLWNDFTPMLFSTESYAYKEMNWLIDNSITLVKCFVKTETKKLNIINKKSENEIRKYLSIMFPDLYTEQEIENIDSEDELMDDFDPYTNYSTDFDETQPDDIVNVVNQDLYGI